MKDECKFLLRCVELPTPLFKPIENLRAQHFNPCEINGVTNYDF